MSRDDASLGFVYVDIGDSDLICFQAKSRRVVPEGALVAVIETGIRSARLGDWVGRRGTASCVLATDRDASSVTELSPWFRVGETLSDELARVDDLDSRRDDHYGGLLVISPTNFC